MLTANDFRKALNQRMNNAFKNGSQFVDIEAGRLTAHWVTTRTPQRIECLFLATS